MQNQFCGNKKIFIFSVFILYLFLTFKAGFVRHDGHAIIAGISLLIAAIMAIFIFEPSRFTAALLLAVVSWSYIDSHSNKTSTSDFYKNINYTYSKTLTGLVDSIRFPDNLPDRFNAAIKKLSKNANFPELSGTTDIYSYDQSYLIASGNRWSPRPVFQSYSVYTPELGKLNKQYLEGPSAPENIIFKIQPIDARLPSIEDGYSWPVILEKYACVAKENDYLFLKKKKSSLNADLKLNSLTQGIYALGEQVQVPHTGKYIFAVINIELNLLGRIANIVFKPTLLKISVSLENGQIKEYRIISGMVKSEFMLSPLIENTSEFGLLYYKSKNLEEKRVVSFSINADSHFALWKSKYLVKFEQMDAGADMAMSTTR